MTGILLADLHAGVKSDSEIFLSSFKNIFEKFIPEIIETKQLNNPTIFILGDLFNDRNYLSSKTINVVLDVFEKCKLDMKILLGNHDIFYKNHRDINSLKILQDKFSNIKIISDITKLTINDRKVVLSPWLVNGEETRELFSEKADLCFTHAEINGFEVVSGHRESNGLGQNLFEDNFKLTFSGHFHIRNQIGSITYLGNPYQLNWGDAGLSKGAYLLDFETLKYEFIENKYAPKFQKIYLSKIKERQVNLKADIPGNFVKLILDSDLTSSELDKLNYLISSLNPLSFEIADGEKIFGEVILSDSSTTPVEYLDEYIETVEFHKDIDKMILKSKITELYNKIENLRLI